MSLLNLFKKTGKEEPDKMSNTELYCQNPRCKNPLISKDEEVAEVNGALVHPTRDCVEGYIVHKTFNSGEMMIYSSINYFTYSTAEKLALKGKVKFSKLETGVKK